MKLKEISEVKPLYENKILKRSYEAGRDYVNAAANADGSTMMDLDMGVKMDKQHYPEHADEIEAEFKRGVKDNAKNYKNWPLDT